MACFLFTFVAAQVKKTAKKLQKLTSTTAVNLKEERNKNKTITSVGMRKGNKKMLYNGFVKRWEQRGREGGRKRKCDFFEF